jgi:hypothetical protein
MHFSFNVVVDYQIQYFFRVGQDFQTSGMDIHFQLFSVLFDVLEIRSCRIDEGFAYLLRPTIFDPSNPEISGFELGKELLPARAKKAGNATSQIRRI